MDPARIIMNININELDIWKLSDGSEHFEQKKRVRDFGGGDRRENYLEIRIVPCSSSSDILDYNLSIY